MIKFINLFSLHVKHKKVHQAGTQTGFRYTQVNSQDIMKKNTAISEITYVKNMKEFDEFVQKQRQNFSAFSTSIDNYVQFKDRNKTIYALQEHLGGYVVQNRFAISQSRYSFSILSCGGNILIL